MTPKCSFFYQKEVPARLAKTGTNIQILCKKSLRDCNIVSLVEIGTNYA
jgi:hypothetical protein